MTLNTWRYITLKHRVTGLPQSCFLSKSTQIWICTLTLQYWTVWLVTLHNYSFAPKTYGILVREYSKHSDSNNHNINKLKLARTNNYIFAHNTSFAHHGSPKCSFLKKRFLCFLWTKMSFKLLFLLNAYISVFLKRQLQAGGI